MPKKLLYEILIFFSCSLLIKSCVYYKVGPFHLVKVLARALSLRVICLSFYIIKLLNSFSEVDKIKESLCDSKDTPINSLDEILDKKNLSVEFVYNINRNRKIKVSKYSFGYQASSEPKLQRIKNKYEIQKLISEENDYLNILNILNWVHSRWEHGISGAHLFNPVSFDSDIVLSAAHHGFKFWCHVYAMTFIQVASSVGYQARLVSLSKERYGSGDIHAVAEVWSNHYEKWFVVDPNFNIWYLREGQPLNSLELHNIILSGELSSVNIKKGVKRPKIELENRVLSLFKYYSYFYVDMRNDWLSNKYFPGHPQRSDFATIFWKDLRLPPVLNLFKKCSNEDDLYWELNRTYLRFQNHGNSDTRQIKVLFNTFTPNFSHFIVVENNGPPMQKTEFEFIWEVRLGNNKISVVSVNESGVFGIEAVVEVYVEERL